MSIRSVVRAQALCGEGPCYDPARGIVLWVDIPSKLLCEYNPATGVNRATQFSDTVTAAIPTTDGRILLCVGTQVILYNRDVSHYHTRCLSYFRSLKQSGEKKVLGTVDEGLPGNRLNDAKCDASGRLWAGTMGPEPVPTKVVPERGSLVCAT